PAGGEPSRARAACASDRRDPQWPHGGVHAVDAATLGRNAEARSRAAGRADEAGTRPRVRPGGAQALPGWLRPSFFARRPSVSCSLGVSAENASTMARTWLGKTFVMSRRPSGVG